jgi:hypothetical protein
MADYKFTGTELFDQSRSLIGKSDGKVVKNKQGSPVGKIDGNKILDHRHVPIGKLDGDKILDARGSKIGTLTDVRKIIDGPGGVTLAALWLLFVR